MDNLEKRVTKLEDNTSQMVTVLNKLELVMETNSKENERHNRKLEEVMTSLSSFNNFMQLTTYKLDEITKDSASTVLSKRVKDLENKVEENTTNGCSALKLAISQDEISKNDLKHVVAKVDDINNNITWLWRTVITGMAALLIKVFVL